MPVTGVAIAGAFHGHVEVHAVGGDGLGEVQAIGDVVCDHGDDGKSLEVNLHEEGVTARRVVANRAYSIGPVQLLDGDETAQLTRPAGPEIVAGR